MVTDGYENASRENSLDDTKKLIQDCEKDDWNFIYLAANQDAFDVGRGFGISYGNTHTYVASSAGVSNMSMTMNNAAVSYRGMSTTDANFKVRSKSLIKDDKDEPQDMGTLTIDNSSGTFTTTDTKDIEDN